MINLEKGNKNKWEPKESRKTEFWSLKKQWCYVQAENSIQAYQDTLAAGNLDANSQVFVTLFTPEFTNPD